MLPQRPSPDAPTPDTPDRGQQRVLDEASAIVAAAAVFGGVCIRADERGRTILECAAKESAAPAFFRLAFEGDGLWVSLVTADRWLSQSIEADLVHTGDKLEELIEEELVDLGVEKVRPKVEHFRSEDRLFTFRSLVGARGSEAGRLGAGFLLAYEACFRNLGDMARGDDD